MPDISPHNAPQSENESSGSRSRICRNAASSQLPPHLPSGATSCVTSLTRAVPSSPPPTYEEVLAENRMVAAAELARAASLESATLDTSASCSVVDNSRKANTLPRGASTTVGRGGAVQIQHKSSKELYRAVAAQWGITCKMSDKCRCFDCQSRYFDCEYEQVDQNEHDKSDGGLGATTPMFIAEVMGGSACNLL